MEKEQIDVLAVMDAQAYAAELYVRGSSLVSKGENDDPRTNPHVAELHSARDAVAEMIAADDEYDAAQSDWENLTRHDSDGASESALSRIADRYEAAAMRRMAALARVRSS